jgi:hypothetical protein
MKKWLLILFGLLLLVGCDATNPAVVDDNPPINVVVEPYFTQIAEGMIPGHAPIARFGYNAAVGTSSEDIWLGSSVYVFPTVAQQMSIVSNSANDSAAGTGARTVTVFYLDQLYAEQTEIVTMNGTAAVLTVATNIFRVNEFMSKTVGSAGSTVGQITISSVGGSPIFRYVFPGFNRSRGSHYTVPAGKTLFVNQWTVGVGGLNASNFARLIFRSTYNDVSGQQLTPGVFFVPQAEIITPNGFADRHFDFPMKFPATTDLKVSAMSDAGSSFIETTWRGWLE